MKRIVLVLLFMFIPTIAMPGFIVQESLLYHSWSDDVDDFSYNRLNNWLFFGAGLNKNNTFFLGYSYYQWSKEHIKSDGADPSKMSITEFGVQLTWFLGDKANWKISGTYSPYVRGTRTLATVDQEIDGKSYIGSFGYQFPIGKTFFIGGSFNYYNLNVSSYTVDDDATEVSETYTDIFPMLEFSMRFR